MNIFDTEFSEIKELPPIDFTAYIDMEKYLDATKTLLKTTKSTRGEIIYYVDCPNEQQHGSNSQTATMIFCDPDYGEKNPIFLCHHSSCKNLSFKDFIDYHNTIDVMQFVVPEYNNDQKPYQHRKIDQDTPEQQELAKHISFYGYDNENYFYFGSDDSYMLQKLKAESITEKSCYSILSNQNLWLQAFTDFSLKKPFMYWNDCAEWLIKKSKQAGPFKQRNIKFLGIHKEKKGFVLNTGTNIILHTGETMTYHEIRNIYKKSLYLPFSNEIDIPEMECTEKQIDDMLSCIDQWPLVSDFDRVKLIGILICGLIPGGLEQRPCGWITAETGSGKTQLFEYIVNNLWRAAGGVICDHDTSAAGIQAASKNCHVSISYDEAEAADRKAAIEKISNVIELVLSSATNGTGETIKSNPYGHALGSKTKSCYMFGSIGDKVDKPSIKRRVVIIQMINSKTEEFKKYRDNWKHLKKITGDVINEKFCSELFLYVFNRLLQINRNIELTDDYLRENTNIDSNLLGLYSSIFGAYLSIKEKFDIKESSFIQLIPFIREIENDGKNTENEKSTGLNMINSLFDIGQTKTFDNKSFYIADLISVSLGGDNFNNKLGLTPDIANDLLGKCGIKVIPSEYQIIISNNNQYLKGFFEKLNYSNYSSRLKTYPGARATSQGVHFYKSGTQRGTIIPLGDEFKIKKDTGKLPEIFETGVIEI